MEEFQDGREEGTEGTDGELQDRIMSLYRLHVEPQLTSLPLDDIPEVKAALHMDQPGLPPLSQLKKFNKHRRQEASLAGHLLRSGLVPPGPSAGLEAEAGLDSAIITVLDFGAGKGSLSLSLSKVFTRSDLAFVCIDRHPYQQQAEKTISLKNQRRFRARVDLADVNLRKMLDAGKTEGSLTTPTSVVGVGKHLCGSALDYALNSLRYYREEGEVPPLKGLAIASCCHASIASLDDTAAGAWLRDICGLSDSDFARLRKWSGFFTASKPEDAKDERLELGRACKRLIDAGRADYIRRHLGLSSVSLIHYVDVDVSPENCLILAT